MQELIAKAQGLAGALQQKISYYGKLISDTNIRAEKMDARDNEFSAKLEDMAVREAKVKPGESVVALREIAENTKREADAQLKDLNTKKDAFNAKTSATRENIANEYKKLALDKAKVEKELVMIQKEWEALEKEKEVWKNKFFETLVATSMKNR